MGTTPPSPHPGADLLEVVRLAVEREGHLLTAGELAVADAILALPDAPRELYARLLAREGPVFRVRALRYELDVAGAVAALVAAGLAHVAIPDDRCAGAFDAEALRAACRRLGLDAKGRRGELVERLEGRRWVDEPVVMPGHAGLVARLERFAGVGRTQLVLERLGKLAWASYTPTGGPGLFRDRAAVLRYERARAGLWEEGEALAVALAGRRSFGPDPWRRAVEAVLAGDPGPDVLRGLVAAGAPVRPQLALRLDREGRRAEAVAVCREPEPDPAAALALERTGRRLARGLGWAPREPLRKPRERVLRLPPGSRGARPTWVTRGGEVFVEAAVLARVADAGREALHAENWLWTSLYALVFRDLYFLPVPGMLPGPRRSGPLDVGTPGFWTRRREAVERRLAEVRERGPAAFAEGWQGERLDGLGAPELAVAWSRRVPGATAAAVLTRLVKEGWAAARGLPDLYVLPGPEVRVGEAVPSTIGNDDLLAEVKGPGDDVSDAQRVWHDHLLRSGIRVEIWRVAPGSPETT